MSASRKSRRLRSIALAVCAAFVAGCAHLQTPRIDPTGQRIFVEPPIRTQPVYQDPLTTADPWEPVAVTLSPTNTVAPIGSQVILVAGVVAGDKHYDMNRRLEWLLAQGSVGQFIAVGRGTFVDLLLGDFTRPRKIDNTFAIGSTSRRYERLNHGTTSPDDDICTVPGQGWISLSSPVEGTSYVTVHAPSVFDWNARTRTAVIHWVDAQFAYPPPSINRAGTTNPLTTTVTRQSDGMPWEGWTVRYRVVSGPPAGFMPDGTDMVEVLTDASGQATAELMQTQPKAGTNIIAIEVYRPTGVLAGLPTTPTAGRLLVGSSSASKTWSAAALAVQTVGPTRATVGAAITYRIVVSNPGDLPAQNVVATDRLPAEVEYLSSNPPAQLVGNQPQWNLGGLAPREHRVLELNVRAKTAGSVTNCVDATADGSLSATGCATTAVEMPSAVVVDSSIDLKIGGPRDAAVGDKVRFPVLITNRGQTPTGQLTIKTRFDEGLQHDVNDPKRTIEANLGSLPSGETHQVDIDFTVLKAGRWCHTVEILDGERILASARACLSASSQSPEQATRQASLSVKKSGPHYGTVGQLAKFIIDVTATGERPLTQVRIVDHYDPALLPKKATEGYKLENGTLVWTFTELLPGKTARLEVQCNCVRPASRTCNRVRVTTNEGATGEAEACLEIAGVSGTTPPRQESGIESGQPSTPNQQPTPPTQPPATPDAGQGPLSLTVTDLRGMVAVGKEFTYVIQIANGGIAPDRNITVTAVAPEGMTPVRLGTTGPTEQPTFDGQTVQFQPVPEIKPGQTLTYRVRVRAQRAGKAAFRVQATSQGHRQPLLAEETTEVFQ